MNTTFIYGLYCPITNELRYIGKTSYPEERYKRHFIDYNNTKKESWIKSLTAKGMQPIMKIIEEVPEECWQEKEKHYISYYLSIGARLVNGTIGGDGGKLMPEALERMKQTRKGVPHIPKKIYCNRGRPLEPEHASAISKGRKGVKVKDSSNIRAAKMHLARAVIQYDLKGNVIAEFETLVNAAKSVDGRPGVITNVCKGRTPTHKGFKWAYKNKSND